LVPSFGGSLGNVAIYCSVGAIARVGYNVPNEFEVPRERTPTRFGFYLWAGLEGRAVLHNIFLDGNTFKSSQHVDRNPFVGDLKVGCTLVLKRIELSALYVLRSPEFDGQQGGDSFGSASVTMKF
jgi:hypothetical protein